MCAFAHTNMFSYGDARIRVVKDEARALSTPLVCRHCEDALCIQACPMDAIRWDAQSRQVILHTGMCTGCGECASVCPYQAIHMSDELGIALKCDLCGGDPQCVKVCRFPEALVWR